MTPDTSRVEGGPCLQSCSTARLAASFVVVVLANVVVWLDVRAAVGGADNDTAALRERSRRTSGDLRAIRHEVAALGSHTGALRRELDRLPDAAAIVAAARPSVFSVLAADGRGTAFVLASGGRRSLLATSAHVVEAAWERRRPVEVVHDDGSRRGRVVALRRRWDLALIRVEPDLPASTPHRPPCASATPSWSWRRPSGFTRAQAPVWSRRCATRQSSCPLPPDREAAEVRCSTATAASSG